MRGDIVLKRKRGRRRHQSKQQDNPAQKAHRCKNWPYQVIGHDSVGQVKGIKTDFQEADILTKSLGALKRFLNHLVLLGEWKNTFRKQAPISKVIMVLVRSLGGVTLYKPYVVVVDDTRLLNTCIYSARTTQYGMEVLYCSIGCRFG